MSDIELVIKIPEEDYEIMKHNIAVNNPLCPLSQEEMVSKVANGIPLPKGHGDLKDEREVVSILLKYAHSEQGRRFANFLVSEIKDAPTIIEADKGVLEKINEKQDSLRAICKAWDEATEKDGYVN